MMETTPTGWQKVPLGELLTRLTNGTTVQQTLEPTGVPVTRIETISNEVVDLDRVRYAHGVNNATIEKYRLWPGDVLFSNINSGIGVGRSAVFKGHSSTVLHGMNLLLLRPSERLDSMFLFYQLKYLRHEGYFLSIAQHAVNQASINQTKLRAVEIGLPALPEQRRIVSAIETQLGRLDAAVARLHTAKAKLKRYKQAVLKAAYTGQLFVEDADMSDDAPLPEGWHWRTLGDFVKIRNGYAFKSTDYRDEGALLIRQSNLGGSKVTTEGARYLPEHYLVEHPGFHVVKGDILIGMSGSIGKLCTYDLDYPALQNQRTGLLQFKDEKQKPWVWSYLPLLEQSLLKQGKGVAVLNVSAKQIESSPVPVAPIEVQQRIIDEVEQRMSTIDETEATLDAQLLQSTRLRQAVLKRAFEGRLV